jgi:hypothetical protein
MEIKHVELFDKLSDEIAELFDQLDSEGRFNKIKELLKEATPYLPKDTSLTFDTLLQLRDNSANKPSIVYYEMGITTAQEGEPYVAYGTSTYTTYLLNGEPVRLPSDYCPNCWGNWDFKLKNHRCSHCGISMGKEVKILLDVNLCPHCEEGTMSSKQPICNKCGCEINPDFIYWG